MFLGRVAAIAFAVVAATLAAQQTQLVHLPIKVTDVTGAVIPGAQIQIDRSSGETKIAVTTDNNGEAAVDLSPENHVVSITAPGFASLNKKIELEGWLRPNIRGCIGGRRGRALRAKCLRRTTH